MSLRISQTTAKKSKNGKKSFSNLKVKRRRRSLMLKLIVWTRFVNEPECLTFYDSTYFTNISTIFFVHHSSIILSPRPTDQPIDLTDSKLAFDKVLRVSVSDKMVKKNGKQDPRRQRTFYKSQLVTIFIQWKIVFSCLMSSFERKNVIFWY